MDLIPTTAISVKDSEYALHSIERGYVEKQLIRFKGNERNLLWSRISFLNYTENSWDPKEDNMYTWSVNFSFFVPGENTLF